MCKAWKILLQVVLFVVVVGICNTGVRAYAADSKLDEIVARGYIMVGTTGDYKPMRRTQFYRWSARIAIWQELVKKGFAN
jgi:hypothetical protein